MAKRDETLVETHYEFGANWARFSEGISEVCVSEAMKGMERLVAGEDIRGKRFIDIGCGSGLHSLAALRWGAAQVLAIDIDARSVATTEAVLHRFAPSGPWRTEVQSVFDMPIEPGFDIVYSWGVLHQTGDMRRAIERAVAKALPGGLICLALYRRTPLCWAWRIEKRIYSHSPRPVRALLEWLYLLGHRMSHMIVGTSYKTYVDNYVGSRGMDFMTDVRDWLGGYPHESISEAEMLELARRLGLDVVRRFCHKPGSGILGSGCDEYVLRRPV
jgi:SAM-dependent methyltransferase